MRCLTVFALFMWLLVVSWSSDYWLGTSPHATLTALVDVKVCLGIPSCVTRWVPRGSRGLILGSTGRGRPILRSTGRGRPLLYPASVFPTSLINFISLVIVVLGVLTILAYFRTDTPCQYCVPVLSIQFRAALCLLIDCSKVTGRDWIMSLSPPY